MDGLPKSKKLVVSPLSKEKTLIEIIRKRDADAEEVKGDSDVFKQYDEENRKKKIYAPRIPGSRKYVIKKEEPEHASSELIESMGGDFVYEDSGMPSLNEESKPYQEQEDAYSIIEKEAQSAKKEPTVAISCGRIG